MSLKRIISVMLCVAFALILCSACSQAEVNSDRIADNNGSNPEDGPQTLDDFENVGTDGTFHEETSYGQINYYINEIKMSDSLAEAGIAEDDYNKSGNDTYDHYLTVSITVENVDIAPADESEAEEIQNSSLINVFNMYIKGDAEEIPVEPVYFNLGGIANQEANRYFEYELPKVGETLDVVVAFGFSDKDISSLKEGSDTLYLIDYIGMEKMKIEGVV